MGALPKGERFQLNGFQGLALWVKIKEKQHVLKNSMCFSQRLQVGEANSSLAQTQRH